MLIDGLIALIQSTPAITAQINGRVYKSVLPRGYTLPAIAVHRYGGTQEYEFAGPTDPNDDQVQFDIYGDTPDDCQAVTALIRNLLQPFTGTLPDGTKVQACYMERDMDMPFLPHADSKGIANRSVLGFHIISI